MITKQPVTLHVPGSVLRDAGKLAAFYGKIGEGLRARGARVDYIQHDRALTDARIAADAGFHIIDHGRNRHPRALNAGLSFVQPYYYLDPWGMRAFSSLAAMEFAPKAIDTVAAAAFRDGLVAKLVLPRRSRFEQPSQVLAVPKGCIAVFLQTETHRDVGELCYLTMRQMIKALMARDDPRAIVIKLHPRDTDMDTLAWLMQKARKDKRLQIIPGNIHDILAACDVVVTINSAVGVEAMLHGKPTVLCGHADFHHCAVTVRTAQALDAGISTALNRDWPFAAFLYWYFALNCVSSTSPTLIDDVLSRIAATGFDLGALGLA